MLNPGQKLDLSFELPDFEKIITLSITCVISAILLSVSFIVGLMWSAEIFEDVESNNLDWAEGDYKEIFLYIGGLVFAAGGVMFAFSTIYSIQQLYKFNIKGTSKPEERTFSVRLLYTACWVDAAAMVILFIAIFAGEMEAFTDITGVI